MGPTLGFFCNKLFESCICSVFLRNIRLGNCWDSAFFWQQSIAKFPFVDCSSAASYKPFLALLLFQAVGGISTCRASSAPKLVGNYLELPSFCAKLFEDFDCELLFCFKLWRGYDSESSYILNTPPPLIWRFRFIIYLKYGPFMWRFRFIIHVEHVPHFTIPVHHIS